MTTLEQANTWTGMTAVDQDGKKIGTIEDIFLDRHTGEPAWATVKTGLFGMKSSFVPLRGAEQAEDGVVHIPIDRELVKHAPKIDADHELTPEQERRLWEHYGRTDYGDWQGDDRTSDLDERSAGTTAEAPVAGEPVVVGVRLRRVVVVAAPEPDDR
jgi:hypothetical protein